MTNQIKDPRLAPWAGVDLVTCDEETVEEFLTALSTLESFDGRNES